MNALNLIIILMVVFVASLIFNPSLLSSLGFNFSNNSSQCTESWQCDDSWSTCSNSQQTRTCIDSNNCGTVINKPITSQECTITCSPNWVLGAWGTCSGGTQTRTVTDSNNCGTTTGKPATSQSCTVTCTSSCTGKTCGDNGCGGSCGTCATGKSCSGGTCITNINYPSLDSYLSANPNVKYWIDLMDSSSKQYFLTYLNNLETTGRTNVPKPNMIQILNAINSLLSAETPLSQQDSDIINQLFAGKVAHSIWLDKNNKVSWKLNYYTREELGYMLNKNSYMTHQWIYLDWNPDLDFDYTSKYIRSTKEQTLNDLLDSLRTFRHVSKGDGPASEASIQGALNDRISQAGCHGMSKVVSALSDNLNIITQDSTIGWIGAGHAGVIFPRLGVLVHGDNIYNSLLRSAPGIELLVPWDYFKTYIEPYGRGGLTGSYGQINYYSFRGNCLIALKYPPVDMKYYCCGGNSKDTCIGKFELGNEHIIPAGSPTICLNSDEINQLYNKMVAMC